MTAYKKKNMLLTINNIHKVDIDTIPIDETWTMGEEKTSTMHSIHAYPAKFPPFITTKALQYANQQGIEVHTVADIFVDVELSHMRH